MLKLFWPTRLDQLSYLQVSIVLQWTFMCKMFRQIFVVVFPFDEGERVQFMSHLSKSVTRISFDAIWVLTFWPTCWDICVSGTLHLDLLRIQMKPSNPGKECMRVDRTSLRLIPRTIRLLCRKNRKRNPLWIHLELAWEGHGKDRRNRYVGFTEKTARNFRSVIMVTRRAV